jgi:phosphoethanolamine N-methyltransferase
MMFARFSRIPRLRDGAPNIKAEDSDDPMSTATPAAPQAPVYDNNGQYTRAGILRYERIFGDGYVSTGGPETTEYLVVRLGDALRPGARVLDVGSGIGGAAFALARRFGAHVVGIDLAPEMLAIASERAGAFDGPGSVAFHHGDILAAEFDGPFDVIWSRDALMHVADKPRLFGRLFDLLAPGGAVAITDYARGAGVVDADFDAYIARTGYHVVSPSEYARLLEQAGFAPVEVEDATERFVAILRDEGERLAEHRADFLREFSEADLAYLLDRWAMKERFCRAGAMKWAIALARKPA